MFRKATGVILLALAGCLLLCCGMTLFMFRQHAALIILPVIYLVLGMGLVTGGAALWGWKRRRMAFGVTLTAVGGILALNAITLPLTLISPEWKQSGTAQYSGLLSMVAWGAGPFAVICLAAGIPLILRQRKLDRPAPPAPPQVPA